MKHFNTPSVVCRHRPLRPGISLLEVLISMFVLMIGLMGVASLFPVGGFYMAKGDRYDRGAVMAGQALDELRTRGLLQPEFWYLSGFPAYVEDSSSLPLLPHLIHPKTETLLAGTFNIDPNTSPLPAPPEAMAGRAFVLDPMGAAAAVFEAGRNDAYLFPYVDLSGTNPGGAVNSAMPVEWQYNASSNPVGYLETLWPIRRITVNDFLGAMGTATAETIFRLQDELAVDLPEDGDAPARQMWELDPNPSANALPVLGRSWQGNYSWLATIVPTATEGIAALQPGHPGYGSFFYEVSVAVMYKRVAEPTIDSERTITAEMDVDSRQLAIYHATDAAAVDDAVDELRSGDWIAVAGINETNGNFLLKWYRLLSLDEETVLNNDSAHQHHERVLMLDGPEWPRPADGSSVAEGLRAIILPGVVTVVTQALPMEGDSLWSVK